MSIVYDYEIETEDEVIHTSIEYIYREGSPNTYEYPGDPAEVEIIGVEVNHVTGHALDLDRDQLTEKKILDYFEDKAIAWVEQEIVDCGILNDYLTEYAEGSEYPHEFN